MSNTAREPDCPQRVRPWLEEAVAQGASDLHLVVDYPPVLRLHGELHALDERPLEEAEMWELLTPLCPQRLLDGFRQRMNADFSLKLRVNQRNERFRANYFMSGGSPGACFRLIPGEIPSFAWAGFPKPLAQRLAHQRNGLVLLSGVAGSGKTTTLAMIVNLLAAEGGYRIITIEEPVEYLFPKTGKSVITQREVGVDVQTFADGLKYGLRQDPDAILVGEIRDRVTAQMALSAAETGHLVLSTLHTRDAKGAISRFTDLFPQDAQRDVRSQLSLSLRAVISQHLLPNVQQGEKRVLALEIMFNNTAIASSIRFGKLESIDNNILTGRSEGMLTLDASIKELLRENRISGQTARRFLSDAQRFR